MSGAVEDLRNDIIKDEGEIINLLRKAYVAFKLKVNEFAQWIWYELNGYPNDDNAPDYRELYGTIQQKSFNTQCSSYSEQICNKKILKPISELLSLADFAQLNPGWNYN